MKDQARLIDVAAPHDPAGVALILHGGASRRGSSSVSPAQLSVLRMIPLARRVARACAGRVAVLRLLNSRRGWDAVHTPLEDVEWAIGELADRIGIRLPVYLVGHSLGGRAALLASGLAPVRGVVALAPWLYPSDGETKVSGTPLVVIHGDADRIADPDRSEGVARTLARANPVSYVAVRGGTHAMLGRRDVFDGLAADCVAWMALGTVTGAIVPRIAAGESRIEV